ncbi:unnamed protein product [Musa textilis]
MIEHTLVVFDVLLLVKKQQRKFSSALEKTLHLKFLRFMKYILEYVKKKLKWPFIFLESKYWMD